MKCFCRMANLAALLKDESKIPTCLHPYLRELRSLFEPIPFESKAETVYTSQPLGDDIVGKLVWRLNDFKADGCLWKASDEWSQLSEDDKRDYSPVVSQGKFCTGILHDGVLFTTHERSADNSVIHAVSRSNGAVMFGQITSIFTHQRIPIRDQPPVIDTWLLVQYYARVPSSKPDPFIRLDMPEVQAHLRLDVLSTPVLTHISEIVAHCAWIRFEKGEIHELLDRKSIALLSLSR